MFRQKERELTEMTHQYEETRENLVQTTTKLEATEQVLTETKAKVEGKFDIFDILMFLTFLTFSHQHLSLSKYPEQADLLLEAKSKEDALTSHKLDLKQQLKKTMDDVTGLHKKVDRKHKVEIENKMNVTNMKQVTLGRYFSVEKKFLFFGAKK